MVETDITTKIVAPSTKQSYNFYELAQKQYDIMKKELYSQQRKIDLLTSVLLEQQEWTVEIIEKTTEHLIAERIYKPLALTSTIISGFCAGIFGILISPIFAIPFILTSGFSLCFWRFQNKKV